MERGADEERRSEPGQVCSQQLVSKTLDSLSTSQSLSHAG